MLDAVTSKSRHALRLSLVLSACASLGLGCVTTKRFFGLCEQPMSEDNAAFQKEARSAVAQAVAEALAQRGLEIAQLEGRDIPEHELRGEDEDQFSVHWNEQFRPVTWPELVRDRDGKIMLLVRAPKVIERRHVVLCGCRSNNAWDKGIPPMDYVRVYEGVPKDVAKVVIAYEERVLEVDYSEGVCPGDRGPAKP